MQLQLRAQNLDLLCRDEIGYESRRDVELVRYSELGVQNCVELGTVGRGCII